jgi:protoporphyrinogen oxidase
MEHSHYDYCIVGAGVSGLTTAYHLLKADQKVLIVERDQRVGGLGKSYNYDGHIFDTGPKRFHTDDQIVIDFIEHVLNENILRIGRSTMVYFLGKYFDWPLGSKDVFKMSIGTSIKCFFDLLKDRQIKDKTSFHDFIYSKYGETLYQIFFAPYTEKFLRWSAEDLHSDWASTGINRSVVDKRIKANTLMDLFKSITLPEKVDTEFLYPSHDGFGGFFEKLFSICSDFNNFEIILRDEIETLEDNGKKFSAITKGGKSFSFDQLIWSGNLNNLNDIISKEEHKVHYLNTIFYNIICKESGIGKNRAQWIYVSQGDSLVSRITCMKEFAPYTCKEGYYNMVCELTDAQNNPIYFKDPENYTSEILDELTEMKFIKSKSFVEDVKVNPIIDTYPIYHKRYLKDFSEIVRKVKKYSNRIHLLGRSGAFWYNNSDHSIRMSIELAKKLLGKETKVFDYRGYFGGKYMDNIDDVKE